MAKGPQQLVHYLRRLAAPPDRVLDAVLLNRFVDATRRTDGMLGPREFAALKPGAVFINVSRGPVAQEPALLAGLQSGKVVAAGLDVFTVEPLPPGHPFWTMPNVLVSPHYSGETVNNSNLPAQRFVRNLHAWLANRELEGNVDLEQGY